MPGDVPRALDELTPRCVAGAAGTNSCSPHLLGRVPPPHERPMSLNSSSPTRPPSVGAVGSPAEEALPERPSVTCPPSDQIGEWAAVLG